MTENHRIRIKLQDFEFEVEGEPSFVKEQFQQITAHERIHKLLKDTALIRETTPVVKEEPTHSVLGMSLQEFYAQKEPKTDAEKAVVIAHWLTYLAKDKKSIFKNSDLVDLWTDVLREPKPAQTSTLSRDAKNKKWFIPAAGKVGYWQVSRYGKEFVENELPKKD